jgi:hypothetical protein
LTLHSRLSALADAVTEIFGWAFQRARADLPNPVVQWGRRPVARRFVLGPAGLLQPDGHVERSWFGKISRVTGPHPATRAASSLKKIEICLPDPSVHRTIVDVNPAIARRGDAVLRTRLLRHCPLPVDRAALTYRIDGIGDNGRVRVDLAIAHRRDVYMASSLGAETADVWSVVIEAGSKTALQIASSESAASPSLSRSPAVRLLLIALMALVCLSAFVDRSERRAEHMAMRREAVLADVRLLRERRLAREEVEPVLRHQAAYAPLTGLLDGLSALSNSAGLVEGQIARIDLVPPDGLRVLPTATSGSTLVVPFGPAGDIDTESVAGEGEP